MLAFLFLCASVIGVFGQDMNSVKDLPKYDARYDYLDVDAILDSKRLVRNYVECLINIKPCTPEGKALKRILPEALRTKCVRCTEKQKRTAVKVIKRLKYEYPTEWAKLSSRWDPTGDFTKFFEDYLAKEHFNTISGNSDIQTPSPAIPSAFPPRFPDIMESSEPPLVTRPPAPTTRPPVVITRPPPPTTRPQPPTPIDYSTSPKPVLLNRFGDDGELMLESPSSVPSTHRPAHTDQPQRPFQTRPTQITWMGSASDSLSTRFPLRSPTEMPPPYSTAITFIDHIGYKIIRTTELVTDILRNTVRAVVGR